MRTLAGRGHANMVGRHAVVGLGAAVVIGGWLGWDNAGAAAPVVPDWGSQVVHVDASRQVVPGPGLPGDVHVQTANNNLDVLRHDGRVWLVFRTAPSHYASPETQLVLLSSEDEHTWRHELTLSMGADLREPRLLDFQGRLFLYFVRLGKTRFAFSPDRAFVVASDPAGGFTQPQPFGEHGFIPWRVRLVDGKPWMIGYTGGDELYRFNGGGLRVELLTTDDGFRFRPLDPSHPVVIAGGASETDFAFLDDGSLVAVARNEAGTGQAWGSFICRAPADALTSWTCRTDARKFDSPLMFRQGDEIYLVARRNHNGDGRYDLGLRFLPDRLETVAYELGYWVQPKRCAVWRYDPQRDSVEFLLDLPSAGDTCFAGSLAEDAGHRVVYDYTSDPTASDRPWVVGQNLATSIYRHVLAFAPQPTALREDPQGAR
jgi:hypothetical protein